MYTSKYNFTNKLFKQILHNEHSHELKGASRTSAEQMIST